MPGIITSSRIRSGMGAVLAIFKQAAPEVVASTRYFGLGKINKDQVEDYATRKGITLEEAERWFDSR